MSAFKKIVFPATVVVLLVLSGLSYGFLVGQSQQARAEKAADQFQVMTEQVQASGALVSKGADAVRRIILK